MLFWRKKKKKVGINEPEKPVEKEEPKPKPKKRLVIVNELIDKEKYKFDASYLDYLYLNVNDENFMTKLLWHNCLICSTNLHVRINSSDTRYSGVLTVPKSSKKTLLKNCLYLALWPATSYYFEVLCSSSTTSSESPENNFEYFLDVSIIQTKIRKCF